MSRNASEFGARVSGSVRFLTVLHFSQSITYPSLYSNWHRTTFRGFASYWRIHVVSRSSQVPNCVSFVDGLGFAPLESDVHSSPSLSGRGSCQRSMDLHTLSGSREKRRHFVRRVVRFGLVWFGSMDGVLAARLSLTRPFSGRSGG